MNIVIYTIRRLHHIEIIALQYHGHPLGIPQQPAETSVHTVILGQSHGWLLCPQLLQYTYMAYLKLPHGKGT